MEICSQFFFGANFIDDSRRLANKKKSQYKQKIQHQLRYQIFI